MQLSQANTLQMIPNHNVPTKREHYSHDTNRHTNVVGRSLQRSQSQPAEIRQRHPLVDEIIDAPFPRGWKPLNID